MEPFLVPAGGRREGPKRGGPPPSLKGSKGTPFKSFLLPAVMPVGGGGSSARGYAFENLGSACPETGPAKGGGGGRKRQGVSISRILQGIGSAIGGGGNSQTLGMRKMSQTIMQLMICFPIWISQSQQPVTFRNRKGGGDEALGGGRNPGISQVGCREQDPLRRSEGAGKGGG